MSQLFEATIKKQGKPGCVSWSSDDITLYIIANNISDAADKAQNEYDKNKSEHKKKKRRLVSVRLLSKQILS